MTLDAAVLPRAAPLDVSGLGTDSRDPFLHGPGDELRSVVGPDVSGNAPQDEEVGQNVDHIDRLELAGDTDRQAFMGLVEHVEHPILASIVGAVLDKVVGPDMIAVLRPQPNARSVGQPEPAALGLLMGNLQPLTLPDTLDPLVVDDPARLAQELGDFAIAIAAVLPGKLDNIGCETLLVVTAARDLALRRAMLPERRTGATLGDMPAALGPAQCRHGDARGRPDHLSRCLDIVAQCRGLLLHFAQAVLDDVADRDDADHLILLDDRNVAELARRHPLHERADSLRLVAYDDIARHHLSKRLREHVGALFAKHPHNVAFG